SNVSGNTATFSNQSQGGTFYNWNFGNGATSTQFNPTYTYPNPGAYTVCLTIYDSTGCQSTYCDSVIISGSGTNCQAYFYGNVSGNTVAFTNNSTPNNNTVTYSWDFGNGTSTAINPSYTYPSAGLYGVCLTMNVLGPNGNITCTSTYCDSVLIQGGGSGNCNASFVDTLVPGTTMIQFSSTSTGNIVSYLWTFPGGSPSTSTSPNPTVQFNSMQPVNVTLTITCLDSAGNTVTSTATKMITFTTDIEDAFIQSASDIYPNPSSTMAYMDIELKENSELSTKIVSVTGQVVAEKTGKYAAGKQQLQLNTESLSAGFYFVQITANGNTVITKKFVKE
ncbi:MAG: PKD domain-containing protein, partial [Bacteroidia bacterium]|nr:PKD domain-containing protein [Bacteroidia bacterium]